MNGFETTRTIIGTVVIFGIIVFALIKLFFKKNPITTSFIAKTSIFAAISIILYIVPYLKFPLPFFPSFLEFHFDEIPIFIAGFAYGPLSAFFIIIIKTIVKLPMTSSLCVGELADLIYSIVFIIPATLIYSKKRNMKGALISILVGTILQTIFASLITSFLVLDFYIFVMGLTKEILLGMCQAVNPNVTSLGWTFFLLVAVPFNALKNAFVVFGTLILYKRLHKIIDKFGPQKN